MFDYLARFFPVAKHSLSYNRAIDGLRGIAVGVVLIFHIWPDLFAFGYVGVDVFFVISGYLITQIIYNKLKKDNFSFKEFYRNRVRRIFPSMLLVTSAALALGWFFLIPSEFETVAKHVKSSSLFYQNFRLMYEVGYWDSSAHLKPLLHYWSLSIEEQYYLLWPTVIIIVYRLRRDFFYSMLAITLVLMVLPHLFHVDLFFHSISRFWELSFGGLTYAATTKVKNINKIGKYQWAIILFFIFGMLIGYNTDNYSTWKTIVLIISTSFTVLLVSFKPEQKLFSFYPLVFLGLISYPLYLWHYVIISYLHILAIDVEKYGLAVVFVSILLAYLTYRFLEYYTRGIKSYKFMILLLVLAGCLAATAQHVRDMDGMPNRPQFNIDQNFQEQLKRPSGKDKSGKELVSSVLTHEPRNNYLKATSVDKDKKYVALVGDSHALAAYAGFKDYLQNNGYEAVLVANSGCIPLINGEIGEDREILEQCSEKIKDVYAFIESFENIEKLIFVGRGQSYAYGTGFGSEEYTFRAFREYYDGAKDYNNAELFFDKLDKTLAYFNDQKYDFYFIMENPELGFEPKNDCISRPYGLGIKNPDCSISYKDYVDRAGAFRARVMDIAGKYSKVNLLDPEGLFCDGTSCYAMKDGLLLYRDDDHLSINGAKLQAEYFIDKIMDAKSPE